MRRLQGFSSYLGAVPHSRCNGHEVEPVPHNEFGLSAYEQQMAGVKRHISKSGVRKDEYGDSTLLKVI
jgi:hypothetical protein